MISSNFDRNVPVHLRRRHRVAIQDRLVDGRFALATEWLLPVAISYSTAPKENRSVRLSNSLARACSGDMYATVPNAAPPPVSGSSVSTVSSSPSPLEDPFSSATSVSPTRSPAPWRVCVAPGPFETISLSQQARQGAGLQAEMAAALSCKGWSLASAQLCTAISTELIPDTWSRTTGY